MNTNRSNLLRAALQTLAISAMPMASHAQNVISINLGANETNGSINTGSALTAGALPIAGTFWNNMSGATQTTPQSLINDLGSPSGASVTWSSANTWRSGSPGGTATSQNGILTKGYLDDGGAGCIVNVNNVPFLAYNVYVIRGSDQGGATNNANANYRPLTVNGTNYQGNQPLNTVSTATIAGGASTTGYNWTNNDTLLDGRNYHFAPNQAGLSLVIRGNTGTGRGPIAGVQIENAYAGTLRYWDIDGSTAGAGGASPTGVWDGSTTNWNNLAGDGTAVAWNGSNEAAVFAAGTGATGSYTVTVDGTQTTDAIILEEGNLTLTGGTINMVNAGVIRSFTGGNTLTINSDVTSVGNVAFDGVGSHVFGGSLVFLDPPENTPRGATNISSPINIPAAGSISQTSTINITGVTAIVDGTLTSLGPINLNGANLLGEGTISAVGNVNLANLGSGNNLTLAGNGSLTATGTLALNRGAVTLSGNAAVSVDQFNNPTAGIASTLNIADNAQLNVTSRMVLGDQTNATITVTQTGGTVTNTGAINNPGGNDMSNRWGHWGGSTTVYNLSGGSLNLTGAPLYLSWDGPATLDISGTGVANLKGINMGFGTRVNASTINLNAGGALNIGSDGIVTGGTANKFINLNGGTLGASADWATGLPVTMVSSSTVNTTGGSISLNGAITGTGDLNITGGKTVVLGGANTFIGATNVSGNSTVRIGNGAIHGSDITLAAGSTIGAGSLAAPGTGLANNVTAANGSGSTYRISPLASDKLDVLDFNVDTSHTVTIVPVGTVAANDVFEVLTYNTLSGAGYAGMNVVSGNPRLVVAKEPDDGVSLDVRVVSFDSVIWKGTDGTNPGLWDVDTTVNWQTDATVVATKFLNNDVVIFDDSAATTNVTLAGTIAPATVTFSNSSLNYALSGDGIGGAGGILKTGTGTVELGNANTYSGGTVVQAGLLRVGNGTAGSAGTGTVDIQGGSLEVNLAAAATYASPTLLAAGTTMTFTGTGDVNTTSTISGSGDLVFNRDGTVLHTGVGTAHLGSVTVNDGTLAIDAVQQANRFAANKLITVNPGATFEYRGVNATPTAGNSIDVTANSGTIRVVSGTSAFATDSHGHMRNITLNGSTMELNYAGTGTAYNGESIQLNGVFAVTGSTPSSIVTGGGADATTSGIAIIATKTFDVADVTSSPAVDLVVNAEIEDFDGGGGAINKAGAGTMALNNDCSYTGATAVQAGTLLVNALNVTSGVTVDSGATLGGTGTVTGGVIVAAGGTVAPGTSAGALNVGGTTLAGTYACELDGANTDTLAVTGNLDLTGSTLAISVLGGGATQSSYIIATYTGGLTGTFASVTGLPSGYAVNYDTPGQILLVGGGGDAYGDWETANGIGGAGSNVDSDGDGIPNGIEFVIGGDPSGPGSDSSGLLPTAAVDATYLTITYRRTDESSGYNPFIEYGSNLTGWTEAEGGVDGVVINETDDFYGAGIDRVQVQIPRALAVSSKLFARLRVDIP
jgi:autotransporter-associated beta strand protein